MRDSPTRKNFVPKKNRFSFVNWWENLKRIVSQSCLDISLGKTTLSSTMKNPESETVLAVNKLFQKVKEQPLRINFCYLSDYGC